MSLFHKNGVITGQVNFYCLPCDVHLGTESDARSHIADARHRQSLDSTSYVDIHKDDGIRKVPQGYYCEYCNKLFVTYFNVRIHVSGGEHRRNKDTTWLQDQGDVVVVLNQLAVDGDSWHGLVDGACALCNSEYLDKEAHKTIPTHLLKLIQSSVELHTSGAIYRKGDNFFHCLICNAVFSFNCFETHFEQKEHVNFYNKCCESFKNRASNGHIDDVGISNGNIQNNYVNVANFSENLDLKLKEIKTTVTELEINMTIENEPQNLRLQRKSADLPLCRAEEEKPPKKDYEYALVVETKIDDVNKNQLNIIASDICQTLQTPVNLEDTLQESLQNSKSEIYAANGKEISRVELTNGQVSERKINIINKNRTETTALESFQTQPTTEFLQEAALESLRNTETEIDTANGREISGLELTNAQVSERKVNKVNKNRTETTAPESFRTQPTTEFLQEAALESLQNTESEINTVNEKQTEGQEFGNKSISIIQEVERSKASKKEKAEQIAKANKIRYKAGYTKAFCSICSTEIPSSLKKIKLHVNNISHMRKAEQIYKHASNVMPQREFVKQIEFEQFEPMTFDVIINNIYCIDLLSYSLLTKYQSYIRCHVCNVNFIVPLFNHHQQSETHKRVLENTSVVCSLPLEFVREVEPGFYHCGFCHKFEGSWQRLTDHCKLPSHAQQKLRASEKLQYFNSL